MEIAIDYFENKTNGVFIEVSALDGEEYSYTIFLEVGTKMLYFIIFFF